MSSNRAPSTLASTLSAVGRLGVPLAAIVLAGSSVTSAATLPPHDALRILIVSDEVNPHGLGDEELTQPGDLSTAFLAPGSGLTLAAQPDGVREIATDDLDQATALLAAPLSDGDHIDVLVYFAHRIPNGTGGADLQEAFVDAVELFLQRGGGVVSFHHGSYLTAGKESMQAVIGARATGSVPWDTVEGQNVIDVAPGHFITTNEVEYPSEVDYEDASFGVPPGLYSAFNNTPDERYPTFVVDPGVGDLEILFASDYDGATHLLGFLHHKPDWNGLVVGYQPGEYQPTALDDLDGNNFQILANAILWAGTRHAFTDGFETGDTSRWGP